MPRPAVMKQMIQDNVALLTSRMTKGESFAHVYVTKFLSEKILLSPKTSNNSFHFPAYIYEKRENSFFSSETPTRRPNLAFAFIKDCATRLGLTFISDGKGDKIQTFGPEDIFHYMYAVFHSPNYRRRYAEFLKIDFPRLPLTSSLELFCELARLGSELVALHLVEAQVQTGISIRHDKTDGWTYAYGTPPPIRVGFIGPAEPVIEKVDWSDDTVWIDAVKPKKGAAYADLTGTVGFHGVPKEVWNFHIGGYQVCQKWLKDRKRRTLAADDLVHYHRIVVALHETIRLMAEIDRVIDAHGGWPLK